MGKFSPPNPFKDPLGFALPGFPGTGSDPFRLAGQLLSPKVPGLAAPPPPASANDPEVEAARRAQLQLYAAQGAGSTLLTGPGGSGNATLGKSQALGA